MCRIFICSLLAILLTRATTQGCTIFVLTDGARTLFFNNEDWSNPNTRIWFVPAGKEHLGCAYVGFDNGWAEGGVNSGGLAFDWLAGFRDKWKRAPGMLTPRGNPAERMLETCQTVEEAIAFYHKYWEPSFSRSRILIADKTGASVIIGARDGKLLVEQSRQCRGFGYRRSTVDRMLANPPAATVANGMKILRACKQAGEFGTKYSNVFDLRNGDIIIFPGGADNDATMEKLNLATEFLKPAHYYDIPNIRTQVAQAPRPLLTNMRRFYLDEFQPIADEPKVTSQVRAMIHDLANGKFEASDYSADLWKELSSKRENFRNELKEHGKLKSLLLVQRNGADGKSSYWYKIEFAKATVLQKWVFDTHFKLAARVTEGIEFTPQ